MHICCILHRIFKHNHFYLLIQMCEEATWFLYLLYMRDQATRGRRSQWVNISRLFFFFRIRYGLKGVARWLDLVGLLASLRACSHHGGRSLHQGGAGTYPSRQRRFLPVPPTLLRWHVSVSPTVLRTYPTGQVRRKESSASRSVGTRGTAQLVLRTQTT
jgi:hypothetical protein